MATQTLPADFLLQPAHHLKAEKVDFTRTQLPELALLYACVIDNVLSPEECQMLLHAAEAAGDGNWERAKINTGSGVQAMYEETRKCGRIIWDAQDVVSRIWERVSHLPEVQEILRLETRPRVTGFGPMKRGEVWRLTRPNERMRFLKYVGGEYFRIHGDGMHESEDKKERSFFTMHLYLNDAGLPPDEELEKLTAVEREAVFSSATIGGATTFQALDLKRRYDVHPKAGRILIFQQRDLLHSGEDVVQGVKYTMRSDLMYALEPNDRLAKKEEEGLIDGMWGEPE